MRKIRLLLSTFVILISVLILSAANGFALGQWHEGTVTKAPWKDEYTFIQIDDVRYTIMEDARLVKVSNKNRMAVKSRIKEHELFEGNHLYYMSEGNRIYQIEKIR